MAKELFNSCIVEYDSVGNVVGVFEIKTLKQEQIVALKKQAKENLAKKLEQENEELEIAKQNEKVAKAKEYRRAVILAKLQFNELVESGKSETTEQFENDYDNFVLLGGELDLENAPTDFKTILERVE